MGKQYTQAFKKKLIEDYFTSNLYFKAYASQVSIPAGTLRGWLRHDKRYKTYTPTDDGSFAPIELSSADPVSQEKIVITYPNGVEVELPSSLSTSIISTLIKAY